MKICWQKEAPIGILGIWSIHYGWDDSFGTGIIRNNVSFAIAIRGYWVGISRYQFRMGFGRPGEGLKMKSQKRCFLFDMNVITCANCQLNYSAANPEEHVFCQEFSIHIDPEDSANNERALNCGYWFPYVMLRSACAPDAPESERWYEKDSMA